MHILERGVRVWVVVIRISGLPAEVEIFHLRQCNRRGIPSVGKWIRSGHCRHLDGVLDGVLVCGCDEATSWTRRRRFPEARARGSEGVTKKVRSWPGGSDRSRERSECGCWRQAQRHGWRASSGLTQTDDADAEREQRGWR
nr:hypothetical protein CFP56_00966 [Quercus suber]